MKSRCFAASFGERKHGKSQVLVDVKALSPHAIVYVLLLLRNNGQWIGIRLCGSASLNATLS